MSSSAPRIAISATVVIVLVGSLLFWTTQKLPWNLRTEKGEDMSSFSNPSGTQGLRPNSRSPGTPDDSASAIESTSSDRGRRAASKALLPTATEPLIKGRILDPSGEAIAETEIELTLNPTRPAPRSPAALTSLRTSTRKNGRFTLEGPKLPDVLGHLTARKDGFTPSKHSNLPIAAGSITPFDLGDITLSRGGGIQGLVRLPGGAPAPGVLVYTIRPGPLGGLEYSRENARVRRTSPIVSTDARGHFSSTGVQSGELLVIADSPDHPLGFAKGLSLREDENLEKILIQLVEPWKISGRVADIAGRPIPGARVIGSPSAESGFGLGELGILLRLETSETWSRGTTTTDSDGQFILTNLIRAPHDLATKAFEASPQSQSEIPAGARNIEFNLEGNGRLVGRVTAAGSSVPVPSFTVEVRAAEEVATWSATTYGARESQSFHSDDGRFTLTDLEPGMYVLTVRAPGFALGRTEPQRVTRDPRGSQVAIALSTGARITGRVLSKKTGLPIPGARVALFAKENEKSAITAVSGKAIPDSKRWRSQVCTVTTDDLGEFECADLESSEYSLTAQADGFAEAKVDGITTSSGETRQLNPVILDVGGEIHGRVLRASGALVPNHGLTLRSASGWFLSGSSDGFGNYRFGSLGAGTYSIQPTTVQFTVIERRSTAGDPSPTPFQLPGTAVTVESGQRRRFDLTLPDGGSITGEILGDLNDLKHPLRVSASKIGRVVVPQTQLADENRHFLFEDLAPGTYHLRVAIGANTVAATEIDLREAEDARTSLVISVGSIRGEVRREDGKPLAGAPVLVRRLRTSEPPPDGHRDKQPIRRAAEALFQSSNFFVHQVESDPGGAFGIEYLPAGNYQIEVRYPGFAQADLVEVRLEDGEAKTGVELVVIPAGAIRGRILEAGGGLGVAFVTVTLTTDGRRPTSIMTDHKGQFRVADLVVGSYRLEATKEGFLIHSLDVWVSTSPSDPLLLEAFPTQD